MYNFFKNLYSVINVENYVCPRDYKKDKYDHFFISHVSKKDFLKDGSYIDEYFQIKSNENRKIFSHYKIRVRTKWGYRTINSKTHHSIHDVIYLN